MSTIQKRLNDLAEDKELFDNVSGKLEYDTERHNVYVEYKWNKGRYLDCSTLSDDEIIDLVEGEINNQLQ